MAQLRAHAASRKIHAALPKSLAAAIPWSLILLIVLELLKRCPMRARPEVLRKRAIDGLAGKRDEVGLVVRKVNKVLRQQNKLLALEQARTLAGTILQAAAEADLDEIAAVIKECRDPEVQGRNGEDA